MGDISCTDYIRMLRDRVSNMEEASEWREFHFHEQIRELEARLAGRDVEILEMQKELHQFRERAPEPTPEAPRPMMKPVQRSMIRIICDHVFRTPAPRQRQVEEDLG